MSKPTEAEVVALATSLLDHDIPVIICRPTKASPDEAQPTVGWRDIDIETCRQKLKGFRYGQDALLMIGGHGVDIIDVDTKGTQPGSIDPFGKFDCYGITSTPSGGWHYIITSNGVGKGNGLVVGGQAVGDYIGGKTDGSSRMGAFLPGSVRPKYGDKMYEFKQPWDVDLCVRSRPDAGVRKALLEAGLSDTLDDGDDDNYVDNSVYRDPKDGLTPYAETVREGEIARLLECDMLGWSGPGWDTTTFEVACKLIRLANANWSGYTLENAYEDLLDNAPNDDGFRASRHKAKWSSAFASVGGASTRDPNDPMKDFPVLNPLPLDQRSAPGLDVSNQGETLDLVFRIIGKESTPLAGLFRRGPDTVYTPRVGEAGYHEPQGGSRDEDGPAQIRRMDATSFCAYVDKRYRVYKMGKGGSQARALFPAEVSRRAMSAPELLDSLRSLASVSHTPFVREDGSVYDVPGYDEVSRTLYLPDRGLTIPGEHRGLGLIEDDLLEGFPFESVHNRANFIGALLTPLLRRMCPPPYPLFAFTAPQPGSGKSLLSHILRIVHGGVFRAEMVRESSELRKQITSILDSTSAPVVTFDNVTGTLKSPILDGLLTSPSWDDRILGVSQDRSMPNDRLWTITGNNLQMGGDLKRRTIWVGIDPGIPNPENRSGFKHADLPVWVEENRGEIIAVLLSMVTKWVEAGKPMVAQARTDSYGVWQRTVTSILLHAGVEGDFNHPDTIKKAGLEDEDEWSVFLAAVAREYGSSAWLVRDVLRKVEYSDGIEAEDLPGDVVLKLTRDPLGAARSLGLWVRNRAGRWTDDGRAVREAGQRQKTMLWRVVSTEDDDLL